MINFDEIPEEDRVCINCVHFGMAMDTGDEYKCGGVRPCSNYHRDNEENYFIPDDLYLQDEYGCDACRNRNGPEYADECATCSRFYSDGWERQE